MAEGRNQNHPPDDLTLVRQVLGRDPAAVDVFLDRMDVIRGIVGRLNRGQRHPLNHETIEDLQQSIFAAIWQQLPTFRGDCQLSTWVFRITFNLFQLEVRKRVRRQILAPVSNESQGLLAAMSERGEGPSSHAEQRDVLTAILAVCETSLNEHQKQVVYGRFMEGLSYEELAQRTGRPPSSLRSDLSRAIHLIRAKLGPRCNT